MTTAGYDFRSPPPAEFGRQVSVWFAEIGRRAGGVFAAGIPFPVSFTPRDPVLVTGRAAFDAVKPDDFCGLLVSADPPATFTLGLAAPLALGLIAGLLGETPNAAPATRPLTPLERPLFDHLVGDILAPLFSAAWPRPGGPTFALGDRGFARDHWRPGNDMAALVRIDVTTPFGDHPLHALLPRAQWSDLLVVATPLPRPTLSPADRDRIESIVKDLNVDLSVELGTADLTLLDLTRLKTGDVVVLNQKVTEPLEARVGGAGKFRVWPGAVGSRCAVQVHALSGRPVAAGEAR